MITQYLGSMPSLIDFKCKTESSECLLDLSLSTNTNTTQTFEQKVRLIISKEHLLDMTQEMATIRQQLFEATNKSKST